MPKIAITIEQVSAMKHAIGFNIKLVKKGVYECYRNYFATGQGNQSWEDLVTIKYATRHKSAIAPDDTVYCVTDKGIAHLEQIYEIKIISHKD